MTNLFERLLSTPEMMEALSDRRFIEAMLRFEAALARAQASAGLIPQAAAQSIVDTCKVELFDVPKLVREAGSGRCATAPLVKSLRETVGMFNPDAARYVHFACSDQDLADSAQVLVTGDALQWVTADLSRAIASLLDLANSHAGDPMLARSALQATSVTTFGLKCTQWAAPLVRAQHRLRVAADNALSVQLGGLLGTQADLQGKGPLVLALMATEFKLKAPALSWQTPRDEWVALACELALLVASIGKIAQDITLMAQFEIAELTPPEHTCMVTLAAARRVPQRLAALLATMAQDHEGDLGHWEAGMAEWPLLLMSTHGAMRATAQMLANLQVHTPRMRSHLEARRAAATTREVAGPLAPELAERVGGLAHQHIHTLRTLIQTTTEG